MAGIIPIALDDELRRLSWNVASPDKGGRNNIGELTSLISRLSPEKKAALMERNTDAKLGLLDYMQFYSDDEELQPVSRVGLEALPYAGFDVPFGFGGETKLKSGAAGLYNQNSNMAYLPGQVRQFSPVAPAHEGLHSLAQNMGWIDMREHGPQSKKGRSHHADVRAVDYLNELAREAEASKDPVSRMRWENRMNSIFTNLAEDAPGESPDESLLRAEKFFPGGIFSQF